MQRGYSSGCAEVESEERALPMRGDELNNICGKSEHITDDAREMWSILRTSSCMARYDKISHEILAELLVAIATKGKVIGGNNRGSDVKSCEYGLIEVKSRILGTDGPYPRVSLKKHNIEKADWIAAVRWDRDYTLHDAIMLPKKSAERLFENKKQASGLAHIGWKEWSEAPDKLSLLDRCINAIGGISRNA